MRKAAFLFLLLCACACAGCVGAARLRAFDEIVALGRVATLRAKLERGKFLFFGRDVQGAKIRFEILHVPKTAEQQKPVYVKLCEAFTDSDGVAHADLKGFFEGMHLIRSTYLAASGVESLSRVFAVKPETPILVCDIDHTIADISPLGLVTTKPEQVAALPGSAETLRKLSEKYVIVYLSARDDSFHGATMEWLALKGFPQGPVFFSDLSKTGFIGSAKRFKSAKLSEWRKAGLNLQVGIGDRPEDAQAYLANNMAAAIITGRPEKLPMRAIAVKSWSEITDLLLK